MFLGIGNTHLGLGMDGGMEEVHRREKISVFPQYLLRSYHGNWYKERGEAIAEDLIQNWE